MCTAHLAERTTAPHHVHYLLRPLAICICNFYKCKLPMNYLVAKVARFWPINIQDTPSRSEFLLQVVRADTRANAGYVKTHVEYDWLLHRQYQLINHRSTYSCSFKPKPSLWYCCPGCPSAVFEQILSQSASYSPFIALR